MEKLQEIINILQANNICNKVLKKSSVSGGCVNSAFKLSTDSGNFFVKVRKELLHYFSITKKKQNKQKYFNIFIFCYQDK